MEITITEIVLFTWAALATGFALKYRDEENRTRFFLKLLIEDETARAKMVSSYEEFKKKVGA
jgi:hypothetical protein